MSPNEFMNEWESPLNKILTPHQIKTCSNVVDVGHRFIADRLSAEYEDMNPEAVQVAEALVVMFSVFIEHAMNPSLVRRAIGAVG